MAKAENLTVTQVRAILDYAPETGVFCWKERSVDMFDDGTHSAERICERWNTRYAGKTTGSPSGKGYLQIRIFDRLYYAHRLAWLIMTGEWPENEIDHENLNKDDNCWSNLRPATRRQNLANKRAQKNNTSGWKGVCLHKPTGKWRARIQISGKQISLGLFDCPAAAQFKYIVESDKRFGKFARAA